MMKMKRVAITPMQGQSLRPLLTGVGEFASRPLFWEHEGNAAIRVGGSKLVRQGGRGPWELFDLKADRTEQQTLAMKHPNQASQLETQWLNWANRANVLPKPQPKAKKAKSQKKGKGV